MPRPITEKYLQTHYQCKCGCNVVEYTTIKMKTTDFKKLGAKRKKDKKQAKFFTTGYSLYSSVFLVHPNKLNANAYAANKSTTCFA